MAEAIATRPSNTDIELEKDYYQKENSDTSAVSTAPTRFRQIRVSSARFEYLPDNSKVNPMPFIRDPILGIEEVELGKSRERFMRIERFSGFIDYEKVIPIHKIFGAG